MSVKVINTPPKGIYERCQEKWGVDFDYTIFTYGDCIHSKFPLTNDLWAHELIHVTQQEVMGKDKWWDKFIEDEQFRLEQEIEAYRAQYKFVLKNVKDRNEQAGFLDFFCRSLSGPMYGNLVTYQEAMRLIKNPNDKI